MQKQNNTGTNKRNFSLDLIKFVALLLIMMVHSSAVVVLLTAPGQTEFTVSTLIDAIVRPGVPLFVMVSGALHLDENKNTDIKTFVVKYVIRLLAIIVVWSAIYAVYFAVVNNQSFWDYFIWFKGSDHAHLWYLYMLLGLYVLTPFLRLWVNNNNKNYVLAFIIICLCVQFVPNYLSIYFPRLTSWVSKFYLSSAMGYVGYYLLGWYVVNAKLNKTAKIALECVAGASAVAIILHCLFPITDYVWGNVASEQGLLVALFSCGIFVALYRPNDQRHCAVVSAIGSKTFGMYVTHIMVLEILTRSIFAYGTVALPVVAYILLLYLLVFAISFAVSTIIYKIPFVNKIFF